FKGGGPPLKTKPRLPTRRRYPQVLRRLRRRTYRCSCHQLRRRLRLRSKKGPKPEVSSTRPCTPVRKPSYAKDEHTKFSGSIPAAYDRYLGPILFQPYAEDLATRLAVNNTGSVLELACGTGILTRVLRTHLPSKVKLIATDLREPMFRQAAAKFGKNERVRWLESDASDLPFADRKFDAVVC